LPDLESTEGLETNRLDRDHTRQLTETSIRTTIRRLPVCFHVFIATSVVASCQFRLESRKRRTFHLAAPHRGSRARMSSELFRAMLAGIGSGPCQSSRVTSRETHFRAQMTMKIELAAEITRILRPDDEARPSSRASSLGNAIRVSRRNYARSLFDRRATRD